MDLKEKSFLPTLWTGLISPAELYSLLRLKGDAGGTSGVCSFLFLHDVKSQISLAQAGHGQSQFLFSPRFQRFQRSFASSCISGSLFSIRAAASHSKQTFSPLLSQLRDLFPQMRIQLLSAWMNPHKQLQLPVVSRRGKPKLNPSSSCFVAFRWKYISYIFIFASKSISGTGWCTKSVLVSSFFGFQNCQWIFSV